MAAKNYYQILQVDPSASPEVIEAAYRRLARMVHPDVNRSPNAVQQMQELNLAFNVLRDPVARARYDETLATAAAQTSPRQTQPGSTSSSSARPGAAGARPGANPAAESVYIPTCCEKCGGSDATLRFVAFPYVVSILILTFRRAWGGLYCAKCRSQEMLKAKLITFLFGWWGIPFGPFYSLGVLFESGGGKDLPDINAPYLVQLGLYFLRNGRLAYAQDAWSASYRYDHDPRLLNTRKFLAARPANLRTRRVHLHPGFPWESL